MRKKILTKSNIVHYKNSHKTRNRREFPQFDMEHLQNKTKNNPKPYS